jgi:hypothetical protein
MVVTASVADPDPNGFFHISDPAHILKIFININVLLPYLLWHSASKFAHETVFSKKNVGFILQPYFFVGSVSGINIPDPQH